MALLRYHYVVALNAHLYAKPAEGLGYDAEVAQRHVFYAHAVAGHGGHADERAHLNHVGQYVVDCSVQPVGADDGEQVAGNAADARPHAVEHVAQLLYVWLASRVIYGGGAPREDGGHDDVGRAGDRSLVEQHVAALQPVGPYLVNVAVFDVAELRPQGLEAEEVGVKAPPPYLVAARRGNDSLAEAGQQRAYQKHAAAQRRALAHKLVAAEEAQVEVVGPECILVAPPAVYLHANVLEQKYQVVDVAYVGNVAYYHLVGSEEGCANHLESLVLGSLRRYGPTERMAALNQE